MINLNPPKNGKHYTQSEVRGKYIDIIDLWMGFCDHLELVNNTSTVNFMKRRMDFLVEEVNELHQALDDDDTIEIIDGAIDVAFVALTQAYHLYRSKGFDEAAARTAVRASMIQVGVTNMTKIIPEKGADAGEKICKPEGWEPPKIQNIIDNHKRTVLEAEEREARAEAG